MQTKPLFNKVLTGSAALAIALTLAGCGHHDTTTTESSSSSVRSAKTASTSKQSSAYRSANKLIQNEDYQGAYDRLNSANNRSTQEDNLATDLQNYMSARNAYRSGNYTTAAATLKEQKSASPKMRKANKKLQKQIAKAQDSSSSSSVAGNKTSSTSQSSTDQTNDDVVVAFANKMGFSGDKGYQIVQTDKSGNTYKFEVRRSNGDNTVANLVGIYQYNNQTGAVTKLS